MRRRYGDRGKAIDFAAAAAFAGAVAFAASALAGSAMAGGLMAGLFAPAAFVFAYSGLSRIEAEPRHALAQFELPPLDAPQDEPEELREDNVVRLFDPRQLAIARSSATSGGPPEDASQALGDALARLKRALRQ